MKKMFSLLVTLILTVSAASMLSGCSIAQPQPREDPVAKLSVAEVKNLYEKAGQYPKNYEEIIKNYLNDVLFDPYSAHVDIMQPRFGYIETGYKHEVKYGWVGVVFINAKNRMGAYTGRKSHGYCIHNGTLTAFEDYNTPKEFPQYSAPVK